MSARMRKLAKKLAPDDQLDEDQFTERFQALVDKMVEERVAEREAKIRETIDSFASAAALDSTIRRRVAAFNAMDVIVIKGVIDLLPVKGRPRWEELLGKVEDLLRARDR